MGSGGTISRGKNRNALNESGRPSDREEHATNYLPDAPLPLDNVRTRGRAGGRGARGSGGGRRFTSMASPKPGLLPFLAHAV